MTYTILLYYKFVPIANTNELVEEMKLFCQKHNLLGRIIIAPEGINGTLGGKPSDIKAYKTYMHAKHEFNDLWFKEQTFDENPFPKLKIRARSELCTLRAGKIDVTKTARHLEPSQVNEFVQTHKDDVVFFDARNTYESKIGKFKDAICPDIKTFYELPNKIPEYADKLKNKKVIMYCTGGVRCETASVLLKNAGVKDIYQINGGIYNYCSQYPNGLFEGACFVFDDRMEVSWNKDGKPIPVSEMNEEQIISHCEFCGIKTARVVNDERYLERVATVCCESCDTKLDVSRMRTKEERKQMLANQKTTRPTQNQTQTTQTIAN